MNTAQVVTIKPQDGVVEYQILDAEGAILSHGHQVAMELVPEQTVADIQAAVDADAQGKGLIPTPEE